MVVTEESGFRLSGVLDGQNRRFTTTRDMRIDLPVEVYLNGDRMLAGLDDGFEVMDVRTIEMKEPPVAVDTLAVKFSADPLPVGVLGGTPQKLTPMVLGQVVLTAQTVSGDEPMQITVRPR